MDDFFRNKMVSKNKAKEGVKHEADGLKSERGAKEPEIESFDSRNYKGTYNLQQDDLFSTSQNSFNGLRSGLEQMRDKSINFTGPYGFTENDTRHSTHSSLNWGILQDGSSYPDQALMKPNNNTKNMNNSIYETSIYSEMNSQAVDDEMVINPRSVFYAEEAMPIVEKKEVPQKEKTKTKEEKKTKRKRSIRLKYKEAIPSALLAGRHSKNEGIKFTRYPGPPPVPITDRPTPLHCGGYAPMYERIRQPIPPEFQNRQFYGPNKIPPPYVRVMPNMIDSFEVPPMGRPPFPPPYRHPNINPSCVALLYSQSRRNIQINQDPQFFRIPQPTNNSLILQDAIRPIKQPQQFKYNRNTKEDTKKVIRLKINGQFLYDHDYINIKGESIPNPSLCNLSDGTFTYHLNEFNGKYGLPKLSVKYTVVMNFLYNEIRKQKGYYNVKPNEWKYLASMVKDFVRIKEIYFFIVYPFEQFLMGNTKVIRYNNKDIINRIEKDYRTFTAQDITLFLRKGVVEDIDLLLNQLDATKMTSECFRIIITFFFDIYYINLKKNQKEECEKISSSNKENIPNSEDIKGFKNYKFHTVLDLDKSKRAGYPEERYLKMINKLSHEKAVEYSKKCLEIAIEFGTMTHLTYKILDLSQQFLNKVYFSVLDCKNMNIFSWEEFYEYTNNCFRNFYPGTDEVYFNLYKKMKHNPLLVLRTMSNVRFSKKKTKRVYKMLTRYITSSIDMFMHQINSRMLVDDKKVFEYIVASFYLSKGFRMKIKDVLVSILEYHVYLYENKIYYKSRNGSDMFKIITRLMLFEDIRVDVLANQDLIKSVKMIPGLRELV